MACAQSLSARLCVSMWLAGWELPLGWATPDEDNGGRGGPSRSGRLKLIYTSKGPGCFPVWEVRGEKRVESGREEGVRDKAEPQMERCIVWEASGGAAVWEMRREERVESKGERERTYIYAAKMEAAEGCGREHSGTTLVDPFRHI